MVLNRYRPQADRILIPLSKPFMRFHPDTLTWLAFVFSILAGLSFFMASGNYHYLLLAFLFILLNAFFDAMDGKIAKLKGIASSRGDFLDHVLDRYADMFMLGGIAFSAYCNLGIGVIAMLGVIFASYMGTQAHAVGAGRDYGGILGRADRLVYLLLFSLIQFFSDSAGIVLIISEYTTSFLELMMIWFAIAGHFTALQRAHRAWKYLSEKDEKNKN